MAVELKSGSSSDIALVDTDNALRVAMNADSAKNGLLAQACRADDGVLTGAIRDIPVEADNDFRMRVGQDNIQFAEFFPGTVVNSGVWRAPVANLANATSNGLLTMNNAGATTASGNARLISFRSFSLVKSTSLVLGFVFQINATSLGILNTTWDMGIGDIPSTGNLNDGICFRMNASGELRIVASYAGTETQSASIDYSSLGVNIAYHALLIIADRRVELWIDNVLFGSLSLPAADGVFTPVVAGPVFARIFNAAVAPASGTKLLLSAVTVSTGGPSAGETLVERMALQGAGAYQVQTGSTTPFYTANFANSAAPALGTATNAVAAYQSLLGGQFLINAPSGAETDLLMFTYQTPIVNNTNVSRNLLIRGVRISTVSLGAVVATTPTVLQWSIAVGATQATLATVADTTTATVGRRIGIGMQSFLVNDAIGTKADDAYMNYECPLVVPPGCFVAIIFKCLVGTATASHQLRGVVVVDGYYA